jgi:demethylmenaquinone methyltransferase/2-methoxy-6-polyprenyl-1,4-benzoquinol methylase
MVLADTDKSRQSRFLHGVFTAVPPCYDLINHLMTFGMDFGWRRMAARECLAGGTKRFLDMCCGTGDLSLAVAWLGGGDVEVVGVDYSQPMLAKARQKAAVLGSNKPVFVSGDISAIPFPDEYFDAAGISFALRNLTYQNPLAQRYLAEVRRVLKPGGRFVIVETSQPKPRPAFVKLLHHFYVSQFVYRLGWWISGNRQSYAYLAESAVNYYSPEELKKLLEAAGFSRVSFRRLFFGAAAIHVAIK